MFMFMLGMMFFFVNCKEKINLEECCHSVSYYIEYKAVHTVEKKKRFKNNIGTLCTYVVFKPLWNKKKYLGKTIIKFRENQWPRNELCDSELRRFV